MRRLLEVSRNVSGCVWSASTRVCEQDEWIFVLSRKEGKQQNRRNVIFEQTDRAYSPLRREERRIALLIKIKPRKREERTREEWWFVNRPTRRCHWTWPKVSLSSSKLLGKSSTWIIHARPVPQDEPLNDSFFLNGRPHTSAHYIGEPWTSVDDLK